MTFTYHDRVVTLDGVVGDHIYDSIVTRKTFYEDRMLDYIMNLPHLDVIVDVGANIGNHTVFCGLFARARHVVAIEPNPVTLPFLERNIRTNGLENTVTICRCAAGAGAGSVGLTASDPHNLGSTGVSGVGDIPVVALDDLLHEPVSLLKIDVEGYEMNVLRGAQAILKNHPHLFIEAQTKEQKAELDAFLKPFGYESANRVFNWTPTYMWS
jgi:protein O-GlcNAc transferase